MVAVAVVVVAAIAVGGFLLQDWFSGRKTRDVPLPATNASAEEVLQTYLDALNAHDCDTATALATESARQQVESWCHHVSSLEHVQVRPASVDAAANQTGFAVTFDLDWRLFRGDGSMDEGPTIWGYFLTRDSASGPWRISDQGMG